ncbi:hypothetical protein ACFX11_019907 [Malus domestica]
MALDDVVKTTTTGPRVEEAMYRTIRWIDRCIEGEIYSSDGHWCFFYAIGGLAGGESKDSFWRVVAQCIAALPGEKPRYVMGVGYPLDIVVYSALGADMYDCLSYTYCSLWYSSCTREPCHATFMRILPIKCTYRMAEDTRPVNSTCNCMVCKNYTRAYIHCLVTKDAMGSQLLSYHNLYYMMKLSRNLHSSIIEGRFPEFVCKFLQQMFPKGDVPEWVCDAMEVAGIDISSCCTPFSSSQD